MKYIDSSRDFQTFHFLTSKTIYFYWKFNVYGFSRFFSLSNDSAQSWYLYDVSQDKHLVNIVLGCHLLQPPFWSEFVPICDFCSNKEICEPNFAANSGSKNFFDTSYYILEIKKKISLWGPEKWKVWGNLIMKIFKNKQAIQTSPRILEF